MKQAFTMIELIFVIVILGILAAIAVPKLGNVKQKAEITKAVTAFSVVTNDALNNYQLNGNQFADDKGTALTKSGDIWKEITHTLTQDGTNANKAVLEVQGETCGTFFVGCDSTSCTRIQFQITSADALKSGNDTCKLFLKDPNLNNMFASDVTTKPSAASGAGPIIWELDLNAGKWGNPGVTITGV